MSFYLQKPVRSKLIRQAARDQPCTLQIVGVCNRNWTTTIFAHLQTPKNTGLSTKASDISGCFACFACHNAVDGRDMKALERISLEDREFYKRRAINRTLHLLIEQSILIIKGGGNDRLDPDTGLLVGENDNKEPPF